VSGYCACCGAPFTIIDQTKNTFCSKRCQRRVAKDRARARKRQAFVAPVNRKRIFERDGWRCQLCHRPVVRTAVVPHPRAPVVDHVVPLARGGTHEPANVQCAHFICNSIKSDQVLGPGEQLRLIG
jgi:5-methylcytosine-specific restriction endonuclease McrA